VSPESLLLRDELAASCGQSCFNDLPKHNTPVYQHPGNGWYPGIQTNAQIFSLMMRHECNMKQNSVAHSLSSFPWFLLQ